MNSQVAPTKSVKQSSLRTWALPNRALTLYYGRPEVQRLSHYFLPRLLFAKKQILYLDGANQISPLLLACSLDHEKRLDAVEKVPDLPIDSPTEPKMS